MTMDPMSQPLFNGYGSGDTSYHGPGYRPISPSPYSTVHPSAGISGDPPPYQQHFAQQHFAQPSYFRPGYQPINPSETNPLAYSHAPNGTEWAKVSHQPENRTFWQVLASQDLWSLLHLLLVWLFLSMTCMFLLFFTWSGSYQTSEDGVYMTADEVIGTVALSAIPNVFSVVFNEVLVERAWRRVQYFALDFDRFDHLRRRRQWNDKLMAKHLRASNFEWYGFCMRAPLCKASSRDYRVLFSWLLLRFGTLLSIASTAYCVTWNPVSQAEDGEATYLGDRRAWWIVVPPTIHALSVFGTFAVWIHSPLALFRSSYNDFHLWKAYQPFINRVRHGSITNSDEVARSLERSAGHDPMLPHKTHKAGMQLGAKLKGTAFGLICMHIPPVLAWLWTYMNQGNRDALWRNDAVRFGLHAAFLAQNILYVVALDFIIWNLSLEGLCRSRSSKSPDPKKVKHLLGLGKSAGLVLFLKAWRQRRPCRAFFFFWLFWLQACAMRALTSFYLVCFQSLHYGSDDDQMSTYDPDFWLGWLIYTAILTYPPILLWLFWQFQAPICDQDGWRWAKLNDARFLNPHQDDIGFYGVKRDAYGARATVAMDVVTFYKTPKEVLI